MLQLPFFPLPTARFLHIAVAQGRRALAYVLAAKMATCGSLDLKEHNGQVQTLNVVNLNEHCNEI